jgi:uracil-DNA glycosylase
MAATKGPASVSLTDPFAMEEWRNAARTLLLAAVPPDLVSWSAGLESDLFATAGVSLPGPGPLDGAASAPKVPRRFLALADAALAHRDPRRHALLYRLLWRLLHGEAALLDDATDADVAEARDWMKAVQRDQHKMKAFLRFRELPDENGEAAYVAWFEPEHRILERVAPFFVRRFGAMRWSILTPERCVHWDRSALHFSAGAIRGDAPAGDAMEDLWRDYYSSIFNPARLKVAAMVREMPKRYWKNLPEARQIPGLIRDATARHDAMIGRPPAPPRRRPTRK